MQPGEKRQRQRDQDFVNASLHSRSILEKVINGKSLLPSKKVLP
jgi:hypothetical protein